MTPRDLLARFLDPHPDLREMARQLAEDDTLTYGEAAP